VLEPLDAVGVEPTGDHGSGVHTRVIPVKKPLLGHHLRPFQLQILYSMGSRTRPGLNPHSSATAAATEAMRIAVRTVSLRRRWRAPWRIKLWSPQAASTVFFYFCKAFAGSGEIGDEVSHPCYPKLCGRGGQRITFFGSVYRSAAEFPVKTGLMKLSHNLFSFIFYFDNELLKSKCREL
jgi:hypothetical protein